MAIPNAFRVLGILGGVLALVAIVVTGTTVRFLVRATEASSAGTYAACAARFCGDAARVAVQLAIVLNNFGIMVVYQIIFGDVLAETPRIYGTSPSSPTAGIRRRGLRGLRRQRHARLPAAACPPRRRPPTRTTRTPRPRRCCRGRSRARGGIVSRSRRRRRAERCAGTRAFLPSRSGRP